MVAESGRPKEAKQPISLDLKQTEALRIYSPESGLGSKAVHR